MENIAYNLGIISSVSSGKQAFKIALEIVQL